jgi:hypothetical protein
MKNKGAGDLVGLMSGDALIFDFQEHELVSVTLILPFEQDAHNSGLH